MLLGEARSKIDHIAGVPLRAVTSKELHILSLAKGVHGTTAIEGNTLSEEQVREHLEGKLHLPPSQAYLQRELDNIVTAFNMARQYVADGEARLTPKAVCVLNGFILSDLELAEGVVPGEVRMGSVGVGRYLGAPAEDCEFLLQRLCSWLGGDDFNGAGDWKLPLDILRAVLAHLYIAWIHPFGDGNGRTARLLEAVILMARRVPTPAAHLLSSHYNTTRTEYYRRRMRLGGRWSTWSPSSSMRSAASLISSASRSPSYARSSGTRGGRTTSRECSRSGPGRRPIDSA